MKIFDLLTRKGKTSQTDSAEAAQQQGLSLKSIHQVIKDFPIGTQLGYYPEYKKDIKLDSLVVAYIINDTVIYSNNDITYTKTAAGPVLNLNTPEGPISVRHVVGFHIVLPLITRTTIDYTSNKGMMVDDAQQSSEKKINDFMRGGSITLFSRTASKMGISHIDTLVTKNIVLKDGLYANSKLVMLEPLLDTFECVDLRRMQRVDTEIPAEIQLPRDKKRYPCLIRDFSSKFIRFELIGNDELQHSLAAKRPLFLIIMPDPQGQQIVLSGIVHRKRKNFVIISLTSLFKKGVFQKFDQLDEFYIKASLLNHPNTKRS